VASQSAARAWARGDLVLARTLYERALAGAEAIEDFGIAGATLLNLALVQSRAGDAAGAMARVDRLLATPQRYGAVLHAAAASRKALLLLDVPDLDAALDWAGRAESVCGAPCAQAAALANLRAHVAWQRGDAAGSARLAEQALAAATQQAQAAEQANAWRQLGRARGQLGQADQAALDVAQALSIDQRLGLPDRVALDLVTAAEIERQRGRVAAAREFYDRARVVYLAASQASSAEAVKRKLDSLDAR
jgi:tetratricopeptide (TPR) repeat protein